MGRLNRWGEDTRPRAMARVAIVLMCVALYPFAAAQATGPDPESSERFVLPRSAIAGAGTPYYENRRHYVGKIHMSIDNVGGYGDPFDGCRGRGAHGIEFPYGDDVTFFYGGGLWIGAVRGRDTLVSLGFDSWFPNLRELYAKPYPEGAIVARTTRPVLKSNGGFRCGDIYYDEAARSEQEFVAVYTDTLVSPRYATIDPADGRQHIPLGIEVTQTSYSWSYGYAQDFVIIEYAVKNITKHMRQAARGGERLERIYIALYGHEGVHHANDGYGWDDDITGMLRTAPMPGYPDLHDTVNVMWMADNDGDPSGGAYGDGSVTSVAGIRILRTPRHDPYVTFNWWAPSGGSSRDWGPNKKDTKVDYTHSGLGLPIGDKVRYQVMSNGEFDYPQVKAAIDHTAEGWLPPFQDPGYAADIADGAHTHFLFSSGPFTLDPDSVLLFTVAIVGGEDFHRDPTVFSTFFDPNDPQPYLDRLDFTDLGRNAQWASWVYDSPGIDTDGDGDRGAYFLSGEDTVFYRGDGVPDFQGPPPPPPPSLRLSTDEGKVVVRWNGQRSETEVDPFSLAADFEGYRVYLSRTGHFEDFALLTSRDKINYERMTWDTFAQKWRVLDAPFTLDSLVTLYDSLSWLQRGYAFHPDSFDVALPESALVVEVQYPKDPARLDTLLHYFRPAGENIMVDDHLLASQIEHGRDVTGVIRKRFPDAEPADTVIGEDGRPYAPFYDYEFAIDGLQIAEPVFLAVTAYDHGDPTLGLDPLESSPVASMVEVWPISSVDNVIDQELKPGVYPNPYRLYDDYNRTGWENPRGLEPDPERARKVTFYNVPDTCTVSIFSLDGDLIKKLEHRANPASSDASVVVWNLITRNTQAIKTGIYLWAVDSRHGTHVGKLVIIK